MWAEFWPFLAIVVTIVIALVGAVDATIRYQMKQLQDLMDMRFALAEDSRQQATKHWEMRFDSLETSAKNDHEAWTRLERELLILKADLPTTYLRREDFVLSQSRMEAKFDSLALKLENIVLKGSPHG